MITLLPIKPSVNIPTKSGSKKWYKEPFAGNFGYSNWPARTNLLTYSEQFDNAAWMSSNSTKTSNITTSPDETSTADRVVSTTGLGYIYQAPSLIIATAYTFSTFLKKDTLNIVGLCFAGAAFPSGGSFAWFDLQNGTVSTDSTITATITALQNGWYRCTATKTTGATAEANIRIQAGVGWGVGTDSWFAWGAQLEVAPFASPYIKTEGTTVTRAATNLTMPTQGVLPVNDFAIWGECIPGASGQAAVARVVLLGSGLNDTGPRFRVDFSNNLNMEKHSGTVGITLSQVYTHLAGTPFQYQAFQSRIYGMGIRVKQQGGAWSAWTLKNDADGRLDAPIASTYSVGNRNGSSHFAGYYPGIIIAAHSDPKAEVERLTTLYGV